MPVLTYASVDEHHKSLQRLQQAEHFLKVSAEQPYCYTALLDVPELFLTKAIRNRPDFDNRYQANLHYFQKDPAQFYKQRINLENFDGFDSVSQGFSHDMIHQGDIADKIFHLPIPKDKPLRAGFIDTWSFFHKAAAIIGQCLAHKRRSGELSDTIFTLTDIARASRRQMKLFERKYETTLTEGLRKMVDKLRESRTNTDVEYHEEMRMEIQRIVSLYGFELVPIENLSLIKDWENVDRTRHFDDMMCSLYDNVDQEGSCLMRFTVFGVRAITGCQIDSVIPVPECLEQWSDYQQPLDDDDVKMSEIYARLQAYVKADPLNQKVLASQEGLSEKEAVDMLVNICLPLKDPRKYYRYLLIRGFERCGKTVWEWLIATIQSCGAFKDYVRLQRCSASRCETTALHISTAPYVTQMRLDHIVKSRTSHRGFFSPFEAGLKSALRSMETALRTTFVTGKSEHNAMIMRSILKERVRRGLDTVVTFDEADIQLCDSVSKFGQQIKACIKEDAGICGVVIVTATMFPLLRTDENRVIDVAEHVAVFLNEAPPDYKGIEEYHIAWEMTGDEKLEDGTSGFNKCLDEYLLIPTDDPKFFNTKTGDRAFPELLAMPKSKINGDNGCVDYARMTSSGLLPGVNYPLKKPICVVIEGRGFHVYVDGEDIYMKPKKGKEVLDQVLERYAKKFNYERHLTIWGYNMATRGVTAQFGKKAIVELNEMENMDMTFVSESKEGGNVLGFVSHIAICNKKSAGSKKRKHGEDDETYFDGRMHMRSIQDIGQQFARACMRRGNYEIEFLETFKIRVAAVKGLLEDLILYRNNETELLSCIAQEESLDAGWELYKESRNGKPVLWSASLANVGSGGRKKVKYDDVLDEAQVENMSVQEKSGLRFRTVNASGLNGLFQFLTRHGEDLLQVFLDSDDDAMFTEREIVQASPRYWAGYEESLTKKVSDRKNQGNTYESRLRKIMTETYDEHFIKRNPSTGSRQYCLKPDVKEYFRRKLREEGTSTRSGVNKSPRPRPTGRGKDWKHRQAIQYAIQQLWSINGRPVVFEEHPLRNSRHLSNQWEQVAEYLIDNGRVIQFDGSKYDSDMERWIESQMIDDKPYLIVQEVPNLRERVGFYVRSMFNVKTPSIKIEKGVYDLNWKRP